MAGTSRRSHERETEKCLGGMHDITPTFPFARVNTSAVKRISS